MDKIQEPGTGCRFRFLGVFPSRRLCGDTVFEICTRRGIPVCKSHADGYPTRFTK